MPMRLHTAFSFFLSVPLAAQTPRALTAGDYARAERYLGATTAPLVAGLSGRPTWLADGRFWYRTTTANGFRFITVDPARRTRASSFDEARLASALSAVSSGRVDPDRLPFATFELSKDGRELTVSVSNRPWKCDLQTYQCVALDTTRVTGAPGSAPRNSSVSPDGRRAAFIRVYNLWVRDLVTGRETQLTTDGVRNFGYATNNAGWIRSDAPVLTWSPDSKKIATFQHDERGTSDMYVVSTNIGAPMLQAWKYPLPGDSVIFRIHRVLIDLDAQNGQGPRVVRLQMPADQHRSTVSDHVACSGGTVCDLSWFPDGSAIAFVSSSRDHKRAWLRVADANTGTVRTLFEERSATHIGDATLRELLWRVLPSSNELIWWSQRDNWIHLYLYDLTTGRLKNRITTGEGNVDELVHVDEKTRTLYFVGIGKEPGRDPYFRHLYKIGVNGRGQMLLTPENADHSITVSPDGRYIVDTYSTPATPPASVLRDMSGKVLVTLERADVSRLLATGWRPPRPITVKGRDGKTDIYGLMFTPSGLDSTRKYPIINYIYPEPTGSVGTRSFSPARADHQAIAELGFVVVVIDGMGTTGRSKAFADVTYGKMGDNTLPDQIAGMKELAQRYPFIDIGRVGVWGHSGGGYATASAMFRYPDFFKVGISESGNHDNRNYEDDWGERYQGLLIGDNYVDQSNLTHAKNLKGKLLLAHGGLDTNVPPYNTYLIIEALARANKDYDLIVFPNAGHGFGALGSYMMRRRWDYFVRHLLGAEPPKEYEIGRSRVAQ